MRDFGRAAIINQLLCPAQKRYMLHFIYQGYSAHFVSFNTIVIIQPKCYFPFDTFHKITFKLTIVYRRWKDFSKGHWISYRFRSRGFNWGAIKRFHSICICEIKWVSQGKLKVAKPWRFFPSNALIHRNITMETPDEKLIRISLYQFSPPRRSCQYPSQHLHITYNLSSLNQVSST